MRDGCSEVENELSYRVVGAAIEVHKILGPGLLESAYEACLAYELAARGMSVQRQLELPVVYKGIRVDCGFRLDLIVEDLLIVELKAVDAVNDLHLAQCMTYLKLTSKRLCLLLNFNVSLMKDGGIKRVVL